MKQKELKLKNSNLAYVDEGSGKTLLLLHGFCGSHAYWEKVIPELSKSYRVIAVDLPGHGKSEKPEGIHTIADMADYMKELLETINIEKVTMFGHSLGGYITLSFAERHSKMLDGFSLIHSTAHPDSEEAKKARLANIEKVKNQGVKELIDNLVPKLFSPENLERYSAEVEMAKNIGYQTSPAGAIMMLTAMKDRPDLNAVLEERNVPVLLVAGEKDQIIPSDKTFSVTKNNIKHALIHDVGHMSMYEAPEELISTILNFLK